MGAEKRTHASASQMRDTLNLRAIVTQERASPPRNATFQLPERGAFSRELREGVLVAFSLSGRSLDDHLPIHPRMRRADVVVDARLIELDGFRLALGQRARAPAVLLQRARVVRNVADIAEAHRRAALDPGAGRRKAVLGIMGADLELIGAHGDRPGRAGNRLRRRRRPQRAELTFKRESPDGIAVGT